LERNPNAGKKVKSIKTTTTQNSEAVAETPVRTSDKKTQKEKGKKKEKADAVPSSNAVATKKQGSTPADDDGEPVPSMIDLRVGRIVDGKAFALFEAYLKPFHSHEASRCGQSLCRSESWCFVYHNFSQTVLAN